MTTQKTIVVFGAGTGLGTAVARRFGREGYRVGLVARRKDALDIVARDLAAEGIESAVFTADLSKTNEVPALIAAIRARFERIDVIEYAPISGVTFLPAAELDAATLQRFVNLYLLTPVEIIRAVLPEMLTRGDGGILIGHGFSAIDPKPFMSGLGPVMAAARNYIYSLHGEVAAKGVYVGTLAITALITGSAGHGILTSGEIDLGLPPGTKLPVVDPDELAARYWDLLSRRDRVEDIYPPASGPVTAEGAP